MLNVGTIQNKIGLIFYQPIAKKNLKILPKLYIPC